MQCDYFDEGRCRSCTHLSTPYPAQLAAKQERVRSLIGERSGLVWDDPEPSPEAHFRAKAKMVVGGSKESPTLGILDSEGYGVDLRRCGLLGPATTAALPVLAEQISRIGLVPYDVPRRSGELKFVHVVESVDAELMVRFVLRSPGQVGRLRRGLAGLQAALAEVGAPAPVVSVNLLPEHKAVTEGAEEIVLTPVSSLRLPVGDVALQVGPGAFLQTNTRVASALYRESARWIAGAAPHRVLDLYCGAGGFALHAGLVPGVDEVAGVELGAEAVAGARRAAREAGSAAVFEVADATGWYVDRCAGGADPAYDLVVVNPPRRGIGARLAGLLESSPVRTVLYSSCHPATLVRDLQAMPSLRPVRARLFDMFPHSDHAEVLVLLRRD